MTSKERAQARRRESRTTRTPAVLGGAPAFEEPVYITRALAPDEDEFSRRVREIFASHWFSNDGTMVRRLEERWVG